MTNRQLLSDFGYEDSIIFDNPSYDAAITGISTDGKIIYDYDKMIACLMDEDNMTYDEAVDFIDYNTVRSLPYAGDGAPIVMYTIKQGGD